MTVPVLREILEQNADLEIIMVSRASFSDLFLEIPRLIFHGLNLEDFEGFFGMRRLATVLVEKYAPDSVADLHNVIRAKILTKSFQRKGIPVFIIDKGKEEKEQLTDIWNLNKQRLKRNSERYADVFRKAGFPVELSHQYRSLLTERSGIGFAPFAQHKGKMLPADKSFEIAKILAEKQQIYFFGGGKEETDTLADWVAQIPNSKSLAGTGTLAEQIEFMSGLILMISMDSANMHLASLAGTRCISVWGSTHPFAGFLGYGQSESDVVEVKDLSCRPCSVFGDIPCYRGDWACLHELSVPQIITKINQALL